jgi:hypothetical protein
MIVAGVGVTSWIQLLLDSQFDRTQTATYAGAAACSLISVEPMGWLDGTHETCW